MRPALPRRHRGVTLIELIVFIVIVGVVAAAMVQAFVATGRGSHLGKEITQATQLAQQRMEVILGQRRALGFAAFDQNTFDPCDTAGSPAWTAEVCTTTNYPAGNFSVQTEFDNPVPACSPDCHEITVTVSGPLSGQLARLTAQVWDY